MHLLTEHIMAIQCPVDTAYRYATDLTRFGEWFPGVVRIQSANTLPSDEPGKQYVETVAIPLRGHRDVTITVRAARHGQYLMTEGSLYPLRPRMEMCFRALGPDSCELTWRMHSRAKGALASLLLIPLARRVLRKRACIGLARLKRGLEAQVGTAD